MLNMEGLDLTDSTAQDIAGSHVILCARGKKMDDIPDRAFEEAASLAAYYSSGREQGKVEIDYLERRNVKKPAGAKPGMVIYHTYRTVIANPYADIVVDALNAEKK